MYLVSIIIPVRNGDPYINSTIQSALTQTISDFELIISENFSTDNTLKTIKSFSDNRIKLVTPPQPLSLVDNWNFALSHAQGEFVVLLGADDVILPDHLETRLNWHRQHPNVEISSGSFETIDSNSKVIAHTTPQHPEIVKASIVLPCLFHGNPINIMTAFFRRTFRGVAWSFPNEPMFPDWKLWMEIIAITGSCGFLEKSTVLYRTHPNSGTNQIMPYNWSYRAALITCEFVDQFNDSLINYGLDPGSIKRDVTSNLWRCALGAIKHRKFDIFKNILKLYSKYHSCYELMLSLAKLFRSKF